MNKVIRAGLSIGLAISALGFITLAAQAAGDSRCQMIYGGGEICKDEVKFSINKLVKRPNADFVENLNTNDPKYTPSQNVDFKIVITNTGNTTINNVVIEDTLPQYIDFVSGAGNYDSSSRKLTFTIQSLEAGKSVEYIIVAKVASSDALPQDQATLCVTNQVKATVSKTSVAQDSAQLCIERPTSKKPTPQVFETTPVKKIPETGAESLVIAGLIPAGVTGFALRRKFKLN